MHPRLAALSRYGAVANQPRFANNGNAFARTVGQLSFGAVALFVFAARDALSVFSSAVFATVAGGAVRIVRANISSATRTVREAARRTRIVARRVVRAGDAFARIRAVERIAFAAGFFRFAITAARTVGNGVAGTAAFVAAFLVFTAAFARTVAADVLTGGTADGGRTNAISRGVNHFFAVAVAFRTRFAGFAFAVNALFARAARRFRAAADGSVVFDVAGRRRSRTRRRRADGDAFAADAFLRRQALVVR